MTSSATEAEFEIRWVAWRDFDPDTLYGLLKLRSDIFVVEQNCVFSEMDGLDPLCEHLVATTGGRVVAVLRVVPPGVKRPHTPSPAADGPAIGRVVVDATHRGTGLARRLMAQAIERCEARDPGSAVYVSAQQHLERFYASMGFERLREPYDEDGIPHVDMRRSPLYSRSAR
jgi:ElaA protein